MLQRTCMRHEVYPWIPGRQNDSGPFFTDFESRSRASRSEKRVRFHPSPERGAHFRRRYRNPTWAKLFRSSRWHAERELLSHSLHVLVHSSVTAGGEGRNRTPNALLTPKIDRFFRLIKHYSATTPELHLHYISAGTSADSRFVNKSRRSGPKVQRAAKEKYVGWTMLAFKSPRQPCPARPQCG